jgi:cell division protein FtsQ
MTGDPPGPRFRRSPAGAAALTVLVLGLGGWAVLNSPIFHTRRIEVRGVRHLSPARVIDAAGVERGDNLVRLSLDDVAARVERLPWVADVAADRNLPSTLRLRVVERTAVGWFHGPAGVVVVARDGNVVELRSGVPGDLPALGSSAQPLEPGQALDAPPPGFRVAASMNDPLRRRVAAAGGSEGEVVLELRGGGTVHYGSLTALRRKNGELTRLLRWARRHRLEIEAIDLRVPQAPTLDPVGGPPGLTVTSSTSVD